jgi:hypothetical protein
VRSYIKEGGLLNSNTSVLEKWKNIIIEKWDMQKWVTGDGRRSWSMAANETSMIFQHIRTKIVVHFANDSNGWIDVRYFAKGAMECVMCCSQGECKPSALGPRCQVSMTETRRFREAPRYVKASDFTVGSWAVQYLNGRWQISNAHDAAIWIVLGEPGVVYFDGLGRAVHIDGNGLKSLSIEDTHRMFFHLANPEELRPADHRGDSDEDEGE